jgi:hypothetical protein
MSVNQSESSSVCDALQRAIDDGVLKVYLKETSPGPAVSYFAEILNSLHTDPCTYLNFKMTKCILIAKNVTDPDDGKIWDIYLLNCPTGPPCHILDTKLQRDAR